MVRYRINRRFVEAYRDELEQIFFGRGFVIAVALGLTIVLILIFSGGLGPPKKEIKEAIFKSYPNVTVVSIENAGPRGYEVKVKHEDGSLGLYQVDYERKTTGRRADRKWRIRTN